MREIIDEHLEKLYKEKDQKKEEKPIKELFDYLFEHRYQCSDRSFGVDEAGLLLISLLYLIFYLFTLFYRLKK